MQDFYKGKKVLITGHTGFKGSWLSTILANWGSEVVGVSSCSKENETRLFDLCEVKSQLTHIKGDVRDFSSMLRVFQERKPEIVFHLAAQPIVRLSYSAPVGTYSTNVMGTVNVLEAVRETDSVKSVLNVTTDKVYENKEWCWGYRENEPLDGYDPYSNSKSCSELVTHSYIRSFFGKQSSSGTSASSEPFGSAGSSDSDKHSVVGDVRDVRVAVSTARAGNVIGGGDFAKDRIIPDCVRAAIKHEDIIVRNPHSIRPYQHVLEPLFAYLLIAQRQYEDSKYSNYYNVGPDEKDCVTTQQLVELFCKHWGEGLKWVNKSEASAPYESNFLKLDCSKMKSVFGWKPRWNIDKAVQKTVEWSKAWRDEEDIKTVRLVMNKQIEEFLSEAGEKH